MNKIKKILTEINPEFIDVLPFIEAQINKIKTDLPQLEQELFSEHSTVLITYADQFIERDQAPLKTLNDFVEKDLESSVSHVHILPFYPWTCDDGFAPVDYKKVAPEYGSWSDVENMKKEKMFDCVFNHLSSSSPLFKKALTGDSQYEKMFHVYSDKEYQTTAFQEMMKKVVRPRVLPLFTPFDFNGEKKWVWTTFSEDQVDTNLNNKDMLQYILESFFLYIEKGATYFRVDAVPFMWKELGTNCSHLEKTHLFVKLLRSIVDELNSSLLIITESNVPYHENITYWGNGSDEAHVIYNFTLAPLLLHALTFETSEKFTDWAKSVFDTSPQTTFLNFTATHDGIGLRGLEGIVSEEDVEVLCQKVLEKGGFVGKKRSRDGSEKPYELNTTWASFMREKEISEESYIKKLVHSQALIMFFPGIGAHYAHNFLGTQNWTQGYEESGIARRLNRKKVNYPIEYDHFSTTVKNKMIELIKYKDSNSVFTPKSDFKMIDLSDHLISFYRFNEMKKTLVIFNITNTAQQVDIDNISYDLGAYDLIFVDEVRN